MKFLSPKSCLRFASPPQLAPRVRTGDRACRHRDGDADAHGVGWTVDGPAGAAASCLNWPATVSAFGYNCTMAMSSRKRQAILWLAVFAASYGGFVWSIAKLVQPLPRTTLNAPGPQAAISFTPNGHYFLSTDVTETGLSHSFSKSPVRVWDVTTGDLISSFGPKDDLAASHKIGNISSADLSPDSRYLAIRTWGENIEVFSIPNGREVAHIEPPKDSVFSFSPDCKFLDVCCGREVRRYDLAGEFVHDAWDRDPGEYSGSNAKSSAFRPCTVALEKRKIDYSRCGKYLLIGRSVRGIEKSERRLFDVSNQPRLIWKGSHSDIESSFDGKTLFITAASHRRKADGEWNISDSDVQISGLSRNSMDREFLRISPNLLLETEGYLTVRRFGTILIASKLWACEGERPRLVKSFSRSGSTLSRDRASLFMFDFDSTSEIWQLSRLKTNVDQTETLRTLQQLPYRLHIGKDELVLGFDSPHNQADVLKLFSRLYEWCGKPAELAAAIRKLESEGPVSEILHSDDGRYESVLFDAHPLEISPDGQMLATQNSNYAIMLWDLPPRRNWPLACGLAVIPAAVGTGLLMLVTSIGGRIVRRFRSPVV